MKLSRTVNKVLAEASHDLAILVTRSKQLNSLTRLLRRELDPKLAPHTYIGGMTDNQLVLLVDSAAWASKLRFSIPNLIPALRAAHHAFSRIEQIQVKILHPVAEPEAESYQRPELNDENAKGLVTLADSVDDAELQAALVRLAKRAK